MKQAVVGLIFFCTLPLLIEAQHFRVRLRSQRGLNKIRCDRIVKSTDPFISNDAFWDYADTMYSPEVSLTTFPGIKVFLHTEHIAAFSNFSRDIMDPFVLITRSNLDALVPYRSSSDQQKLLPAYTAILGHPNLIHWFASNKVSQHHKLTALPLGPKWQWNSTAFHGEDRKKGALLKVLAQHGLNAHNNFYGKQKPGLLFASMTESSSDQAMYAPWRGARRDAIKALQANLSSLHEPRYIIDQDALVTVGDCQVRRASEEYMLKLQHYKFVLSPPGNGPDTHRTWEALLMGCIPVVMAGPLDDLYVDLPVLVLKSWSELTPERLRTAYSELRFGQQVYAFEKLFTAYWYHLIDTTIQTALQSDL